MKIERKKIRALKKYPIYKRDGKNETDFNIFLYEDNSKGLKEYAFIITNQDAKDEVVDRTKIISTITMTSQDDVLFVVNNLGNSVKYIYSLDRPYKDQDFLLNIQENIKNINANIWINPTASKFVSIQEKQEIANKIEERKNKFNNLSQDDKDIFAIKPIVLLNVLNKLNIINIFDMGENGDELKHKLTFNNVSTHGNQVFNISVAKYENLKSEKSNLFKDFLHDHVKGIGSGSIGLINHLGINGLFNDYPNYQGFTLSDANKPELIEIGRNYLKEKVLPFVDKKDFIYHETNINQGANLFLGKSITLPPIKNNNPKTLKLMSNFLEYRGISTELINKLIDDGIIFSGNSYVSRIIKEINPKTNKQKPNMTYYNDPYISFIDSQKNLCMGEKFYIKETNDKNKPYEYNKLNITAFNGRYVGFGEMNNPTMAIIHEAAIDAMSSYEILKYSNINENKVKYISTQGASHMQGLFINNLKIWGEFSDKFVSNKENNGCRLRTYFINEVVRDLTPELINSYHEKLTDKKIVFFDTDDYPMKNSTIRKLDLLKSVIGLDYKIEKLKKDVDINFKNYDNLNSFFLNQSNFFDFCKELKLKIEYDTKQKDFILKSRWEKESNIPFNPKYKDNIRKRFVNFFGTDHLVFCLDNDEAGLKHMVFFTELQRHLDLKISYMIPKDIKYDHFQGLTLNQMLKEYKELCSQNKYEDAYSILNKYKLQSPNNDNNDTLKHLLKLRKEDPIEAQKMIQEINNSLVVNNDLSVKKNLSYKQKIS